MEAPEFNGLTKAVNVDSIRHSFGFKQSPKAWFSRINMGMQNEIMTKPGDYPPHQAFNL